LPLQRLAELGFSIVLLPISALLAATDALQHVLRDIRQGGMPASPDGTRPDFGDFLDIIGASEIDELGRRFGSAGDG